MSSRVSQPLRHPQKVHPLDSFHPYRILRPLKERGMSHVYKAVYLGTHGFRAPVAIKIANSHSPKAHWIHHEARLLAALSGPHLPRVYDVGTLGDTPYFSMEWIDGHSLRTLLKTRSLPMAVILDVMIQLCDALSTLHGAEHPIIHGDIKPANIMVNPRGHLTLVDLGISRHIGQQRQKTTYGTVAYMSPEQIEQGQLTPPSDIFAMGILLFEMLVGHRLFTGTIPQILFQRAQPFSVSYRQQIAQQIPTAYEPLTPLLLDCLQTEATSRPQCVESIREALCAVMHPLRAKSVARKWWTRQAIGRSV